MEPSRSGHRQHVRALDGLRGLAAAVVVLHHAMLASSQTLEAQYVGGAPPATWSLGWWLSRTPLHIFWAGQEMVIVFFVLSGYVLALPAVSRGWRWFDASYYARRVPRLFIPFWGALLLAVLWRQGPGRGIIPGATLWLVVHAVPLPHNALLTASMWFQPGALQWNSVIWSLHYELEFSVLLPLMLVVPLLTRRRPVLALLAALACLALVWHGAQSQQAQLRFMPTFELGALLAFHRHRLGSIPRLLEAPALILCAALLTADACLQNTGYQTAAGVPSVLVVAGATMAVWCATAAGGLRRLLESRAGAGLGARSYSLYLVHEPILVAAAFLLGARPSPLLLLAVALPVICVVCLVFWRCVERPSISLARSCGAWMDVLSAPVAALVSDGFSRANSRWAISRASGSVTRVK